MPQHVVVVRSISTTSEIVRQKRDTFSTVWDWFNVGIKSKTTNPCVILQQYKLLQSIISIIYKRPSVKGSYDEVLRETSSAGTNIILST